MAQQFGIRITVLPNDLEDIRTSISNALTKERFKVKIGADTTEIENAIKRIKSELSLISNNTGITIKDSIGISKNTSGKADSFASLNGITKDQDKELDKFVKDYRKSLGIVENTAELTSKDIHEKFKVAILDIFKQLDSGNIAGFEASLERLKTLTSDLSRQFKDPIAVQAWEDWKEQTNGIIVVSKNAKKELLATRDSAKALLNELIKLVGIKGIKYSENYGTDSWLQDTNFPEYRYRTEKGYEFYNEQDALEKIIEEGKKRKAAASKTSSIIDNPEFTKEDLNALIKGGYELYKARQQQANATEKAVQAENNLNAAQKQTVTALRSVEQVTESLNIGFDPERVSRIMSVISSHKNVVDSLGRSIDNVYSNPLLDPNAAFSQITNAVELFEKGLYSPDMLAKKFEIIGGVQQKNTEITKESTKAINEQNTALKEQNKTVNGQNIKNKGNVGSVSIKADTKALLKSIRNSITEINSGNKLATKPIRVFASTSKLLESIKKSISKINTSGSLSSNPINLVARFNAKEVAKNLQAQLKGMNVTIGVNGANTANSVNSATESAKQQKRAQESVGNTAKNASQKIVDGAKQSADAEKQLSEEIKNNNRLLSIRENKNLKTGDVIRSEKSGDSTSTVTHTEFNGKPVSEVTYTNFEKQRREMEKSNAKAIQLQSMLDKVKMSWSDIFDTDPVNKKNLDDLNAKHKEITENIKKEKEAYSLTKDSVIQDIKAQISALETLAKKAKSGSSLRVKDVGTSKELLQNEFAEFVSKTIKSGNYSAVANEIKNVEAAIKSISNKDSLHNALNQFDILKEKVKSINEEARSFADISKQITNAISKLNGIVNNTTLKRKSGYDLEGYNNLIAQINGDKNQNITGLIDKFSALKNSLASADSAQDLEKIRAALIELEKELSGVVAKAENMQSAFKNTTIDEGMQKKFAQTKALLADIERKNALAMGKVDTVSGNGLTFGAEIQQLNQQLKETPEKIDEINNKARILQSNIKTLGYEGNTLLGEIKTQVIKFIKWTGTTMLVMKARMYFRQLFTNVMELDTALTDLKKTFIGTDAELEKFYYDANKLAKQMGVTTKEIIEQGSAWSRLNKIGLLYGNI